MDRHPETHDQPRTSTPSRVTSRLVACLLAVLLAASVAAVPAGAQTPTRPGDPTTAEAQFLSLLNQERGKAGLAPLQSNANLVGDARGWSRVMADRNELFHTGTLAADTARSIPDWSRAGENVGRGWSVESLHRAFVASPGHYRNIVGDYRYVGIGVVYTAERTWVTFRFANARTAAIDVAASTATNPVMSTSHASGMVRRLYLAYFRREPDAGGIRYWVDRLVYGRAGLGDVSNAFSQSSEFRNTYGSLSNTGFVGLVYRNVMSREPDAGGYDYWVRRMDQGLSRGELMVEFSESPEFKRKTA